jgi:hypothetical protein
MREATAAIVIATASAGISAASVTWQVTSWKLSAGRLKVSLLHGVSTGTGYVASPITRDGRPQTRVADQGWISGPSALGIEVVNVGRSPVTLMRYGARDRGHGISYAPIRDFDGPSFPHRLAPGEGATWLLPPGAIPAIAAGGKPRGRRAEASRCGCRLRRARRTQPSGRSGPSVLAGPVEHLSATSSEVIGNEGQRQTSTTKAIRDVRAGQMPSWPQNLRIRNIQASRSVRTRPMGRLVRPAHDQGAGCSQGMRW